MWKLRHNMAPWDRALRLSTGFLMLLVGPLTDLLVTDLLSNILLSGVGGLALLSGAFAWCFLYELTGLRSAE